MDGSVLAAARNRKTHSSEMHHCVHAEAWTTVDVYACFLRTAATITLSTVQGLRGEFLVTVLFFQFLLRFTSPFQWMMNLLAGSTVGINPISNYNFILTVSFLS